jgi:hypothetical protein
MREPSTPCREQQAVVEAHRAAVDDVLVFLDKRVVAPRMPKADANAAARRRRPPRRRCAIGMTARIAANAEVLRPP